MRVLLIERYAMTRDLLATYLEGSTPNLAVIAADSFSNGIERARSQDAFDVIVADLQSASTRGLADVLAVHAACGETPIIVLSDNVKADEIFDAYGKGVAGFVPKTLPARILSLAIQLVMSGEKFIPSALLSAVQSGISPDRIPATKEECLPELTRRERDVLALLFEGHSNAQIADDLSIAANTARLHVSGLLRKLGARNRLQAVRIAAARGFRA